jgi:hypothetical protein
MVQRRLLVSSVPEPAKPVGPENPVVVEIAHEALLRTWKPLKDWIEDGQEELLQRRRARPQLRGDAEEDERRAPAVQRRSESATLGHRHVQESHA